MTHKLLVNIIGIILIGTSILDALKYELQAQKMLKAKSSKNISRRFINWALLNDLVKLLYGVLILDIYISFTSILSLVTMCHFWYVQYLYYPFRRRGLHNFKRPGLVTYFINSLIPNSKRKRL
jgi:uncharacterized protein with PQ loop repeat